MKPILKPKYRDVILQNTFFHTRFPLQGCACETLLQQPENTYIVIN